MAVLVNGTAYGDCDVACGHPNYHHAKAFVGLMQEAFSNVPALVAEAGVQKWSLSCTDKDYPVIPNPNLVPSLASGVPVVPSMQVRCSPRTAHP